jgi:uncharacterized membrane protein YqjE
MGSGTSIKRMGVLQIKMIPNDEIAGQARVFSGSLRRLSNTLLGIIQNRIELLAVEFQEEKCRLLEVFMLAAAAVALGLMALMLVTITVALLLPEPARVVALIVLCLLFIAGAVWAYWSLQRRLNDWSPFAGTMDEIKKDKAWLQGKN